MKSDPKRTVGACARSVLDCGGPLPLLRPGRGESASPPPLFRPGRAESARGLAHSKALRASRRTSRFHRLWRRLGHEVCPGNDGWVHVGEPSWTAPVPCRFSDQAVRKAPEDWRTPRRFARAGAHPVFIVCGAAWGMKSDQKTVLSRGLTPRGRAATKATGELQTTNCKLQLEFSPALGTCEAGRWQLAVRSDRARPEERVGAVGVRFDN